MQPTTHARPRLHLAWSNPEVVRMAGSPLPLTMPRYRDVRVDPLLVNVETIRCDAAPFIKHAQGIGAVYLGIEPRAPLMAVFRRRAPDDAWPINFRVAADVHGPALARWLDDHERDLERVLELSTEAGEVDAELLMGRLQAQLTILETAALRTPQQWLSSSLIAHDHFDLPTLDYSKAARIGILGIGAVNASSSDAEILLLAQKAAALMKGVDLDEGTALTELAQMFAELRVVLGGQTDTDELSDSYARLTQ